MLSYVKKNGQDYYNDLIKCDLEEFDEQFGDVFILAGENIQIVISLLS